MGYGIRDLESVQNNASREDVKDSALKGLAVEIRGLNKTYGRTQVLRDLDLEVPWGQVLTVLGPNGSGKTTLIKILATVTRPDEGTIRVAGLEGASHGQWIRRIIGVVTHEPLLYDELTGYENLRFVGRMFGLDRLDERIASVAEQIGVTARLQQRVGTLSHGGRKRIAIARALLHDPPLLLMDEPETGLDQDALERLEAIVRDPAHPSRTIIMTTHNLERGVALADRLAILSRGSIADQQDLGSSTGAESIRDAYFRHTGAAW